MILDCHTHIGFGRLDGRPSSLIASMETAGIDKSLVFAGKLGDCSTNRLLEEIQPYKGRLYAIGYASPEKGGWSMLATEADTLLASGLIHGLKFYTGYEHFYPDDMAIRPFLELLLKHDRPAIFHSGDTYSGASRAKLKYAHPLHIDDIAVEMPNLKIVIAHMGYPWVIDAAEVCYKNKNVYVDCSGFVYGTFGDTEQAAFSDMWWNDFVRVAGSTDRIMFGTDWPISNQKSYLRAVKETLAGAEKDEILGNRAARLFGIND